MTAYCKKHKQLYFTSLGTAQIEEYKLKGIALPDERCPKCKKEE